MKARSHRGEIGVASLAHASQPTGAASKGNSKNSISLVIKEEPAEASEVPEFSKIPRRQASSAMVFMICCRYTLHDYHVRKSDGDCLRD